MTTASLHATPAQRGSWFSRSEQWLDDRGKGAWIVAMILGFIFIWPIGLALLAYMIWSNRLFNGKSARRAYHAKVAFKTSGNTAFDAYKSDTLRRLQDEQDHFEQFLDRLRDAKDKAEFDQFMAERDKRQDTKDAETIDA